MFDDDGSEVFPPPQATNKLVTVLNIETISTGGSFRLYSGFVCGQSCKLLVKAICFVSVVGAEGGIFDGF